MARVEPAAKLPRLIIDVDGVLSDFQPVYIAFMEAEFPELAPFPTPNNIDYPDNWDYDKDRMKAVGWSDTEIRARRKHLWTLIANSPTFWIQEPPYPTARRDIASLLQASQAAWNIYFVTQRPGGTAKFQTELWLAKYGMKAPFFPTVITVQDGEQKANLCRALNIDAIIDDKPSTIASIPGPTRRYLMDRPWNRAFFDDATAHYTTTEDQMPVIKVESVTDMLEVEDQHYREYLQVLEESQTAVQQ